jgi:uncharacterized protein YhjY with autotransporter beta-barrel domain
LPLAVIGFLTGIGSHNPARAQTFSEANTARLTAICSDTTLTGEAKGVSSSSKIHPNSGSICQAVSQAGTGGTKVAGAGANSPAQIEVEKLRERNILVASKEGGGGSADTLATSLDGRGSVFLLAGVESLRHHNNDFEEGYDSTIPSVILGTDYRITKAFSMGVAFNYSHWDASFDSAGGFDIDSYGPLLSLHFLPFDRAFASVVLGYARQNNTRSRQAELQSASGDKSLFNGLAPGNTDFNQYRVSILTGYDYPIAAFTIGPRLGLDVTHWQMESYQEHGDTGLELQYRGFDVTSVQSSLGATATLAFSTAFGTMVPQLTATWVHEFANDQRTIHAKFVEAPNSAEFTFQRESPARNWAVINLAVSALLSHGQQLFVNFVTMQGNQHFRTYGGAIGMLVKW